VRARAFDALSIAGGIILAAVGFRLLDLIGLHLGLG